MKVVAIQGIVDMDIKRRTVQCRENNSQFEAPSTYRVLAILGFTFHSHSLYSL